MSERVKHFIRNDDIDIYKRSRFVRKKRKGVIFMKINGVNHSNIHPYHKQMQPPQKDAEIQSGDKLDISPEAKQLQQQSRISLERQEKINALKQQIEAGEYEVNPKKAAQTSYEFWMGR